MKAEYDFSKMMSRKNPYASKLKKSVTIRLGEDVIEYFKAMAEKRESRIKATSICISEIASRSTGSLILVGSGESADQTFKRAPITPHLFRHAFGIVGQPITPCPTPLN